MSSSDVPAKKISSACRSGSCSFVASVRSYFMTKLRVNAFSISIDGYGAGVEQALENPMGVGGMALHKWVFGTKTFQKMTGHPLSADQTLREDVDDRFAARGFENLGAWIMGRNMFTPSRGAWPADDWKGWWGANPPYHVPVFVLTHHAREPITMAGGTTLRSACRIAYFVSVECGGSFRSTGTVAATSKTARSRNGTRSSNEWAIDIRSALTRMSPRSHV